MVPDAPHEKFSGKFIHESFVDTAGASKGSEASGKQASEFGTALLHKLREIFGVSCSSAALEIPHVGLAFLADETQKKFVMEFY